MKLYYSPGACSLGIRVILEEIGKPYEDQLVSLREGAHLTPEYRAINPKAKVPAVALDDGQILTEWMAIAGYLAATNPDAHLVPEDKMEWARATEYTAYANSTMHAQGFTRIFRPDKFSPDPEHKEAVRAEGKRVFAEGFATMDKALGDKEWLLSHYTTADAALFYVSFWAEGRNTIELPPRISAHYARMKARPAVARAMAAEGLPM